MTISKGDVVELLPGMNHRNFSIEYGVHYMVEDVVHTAEGTDMVLLKGVTGRYYTYRFTLAYGYEPNKFYVGHLSENDTFWLDSTFDNEADAEAFAAKWAENHNQVSQVLTVRSTFKVETQVVKS
jgi:hypothetical protein